MEAVLADPVGYRKGLGWIVEWPSITWVPGRWGGDWHRQEIIIRRRFLRRKNADACARAIAQLRKGAEA